MKKLLITFLFLCVSCLTALAPQGGPIASFSPTSLTFANQITSTTSPSQVVTLTNTGTVTMTGIIIALQTGTQYAIASTTCTSNLTVSATCTVSVTFTPTTTGVKTDNIQFTDSASGSPQSVPLTGTGITSSPGTSFTPSSLAFGNQAVGTTSASQTVTLTNNGGGSLTISSITLQTGTDYNITAKSCLSTLLPSATCTVTITFSPTTTGSRTDNIQFTDSASGSPQDVGLSGTGTNAGISFSPSALSFGNQVLSTTSPGQTITVENTGSATLSISSIVLQTGTQFAISANSCGSTLAASSSCYVTITFTPLVIGVLMDDIVFTDNASGSPQSVPLSGSGGISGPTNDINLDTQIKGSRPPSFGVDSGTANAYSIETMAPLGPALRIGSQFTFLALNGNTGASTLAVDAGTAIPIKYDVNLNLPSGCIASGQMEMVGYDGTNFQLMTSCDAGTSTAFGCGSATGYTNSFTLTIAAQTGQSGNLTNWPMVFTGNSILKSTGNGGYSQASGSDVVFCTANNGTGSIIPSEDVVSSYSASTGGGEWWILVPTISHTTSTTIYGLVGKSSPINYNNPFTFTAGVSGTCVANEAVQQATSSVTATLLTLSSPYTISNLSGVPISGAGTTWTGQTSGCVLTSSGGSATPVSTIWPGFIFVQHLGNSSSLVLTDSTEQYTFSNDGATAVAGQISGGAGFLGSSSQFILSNQTVPVSGSFTMEQWVANGNAGNAIQSWGGNTYTVPETSGINTYAFLSGTDTCAVVACASTCYQSSDTYYCRNSAGNIGTSNTWHHVVGTHTTGTANLTTYLDGAVSNGSVVTGSNPTDPGTEYSYWAWGRLGEYSTPYYYTGYIDELRMYQGVYTGDQVLFDYNNQSNPTGTYTLTTP